MTFSQAVRRVALLAHAALATSSAQAGVPARSIAGTPVHWTASEIVLQPARPPTHTGLSSDDLVRALEAGARAWNTALHGCRAPRLRVGPVSEVAREARKDGVSVIAVRGGSWCPAGARDWDDCYDHRRAAITHLYPSDEPNSAHDGRLHEADVEINAIHFAWSFEGNALDRKSLRAIVAHELGHVLGLDHSCAPMPNASLRACSAAASKQSIMYPDPVEAGRPSVLVPGVSEVGALCRLYPPEYGPVWTVRAWLGAALACCGGLLVCAALWRGRARSH